MNTKVVPEGFVARTIALPGLGAGAYNGLAAGEGAFFYTKGTPETGVSLQRDDLKERKEEKVVDGAGGFELSRDGRSS